MVADSPSAISSPDVNVNIPVFEPEPVNPELIVNPELEPIEEICGALNNVYSPAVDGVPATYVPKASVSVSNN